MLMYRTKITANKEYVVVSYEAAKNSGVPYRRISEGKYEIYTDVKKVVEDRDKKILIVGYKGDPLTTGKMVRMNIKRIGVFEQKDGTTFPAYTVEP